MGMGAYFPIKHDCKAHGRLFSMGAYFWVGAYFPVNTVLLLLLLIIIIIINNIIIMSVI